MVMAIADVFSVGIVLPCRKRKRPIKTISWFCTAITTDGSAVFLWVHSLVRKTGVVPEVLDGQVDVDIACDGAFENILIVYRSLSRSTIPDTWPDYVFFLDRFAVVLRFHLGESLT